MQKLISLPLTRGGLCTWHTDGTVPCSWLLCCPLRLLWHGARCMCSVVSPMCCVWTVLMWPSCQTSESSARTRWLIHICHMADSPHSRRGWPCVESLSEWCYCERRDIHFYSLCHTGEVLRSEWVCPKGTWLPFRLEWQEYQRTQGRAYLNYITICFSITIQNGLHLDIDC